MSNLQEKNSNTKKSKKELHHNETFSSKHEITSVTYNHNMLPMVEFLLYETGHISRLPLRQIFQMQTVCTHWRQLLGNFIRPKPKSDLIPVAVYNNLLRTDASKEELWFIMTREHEESYERWHSWVFSNRDGTLFKPPQIPTSNDQLSKILGRTDYYIHSVYRMKSLKGLIFALVKMITHAGASECNVIVFNCFNGYTKLLPCNILTRERLPRMRIAFHQQDISRYYIMHSFSDYYCVSSKYEALDFDELFVYDSAKESWKLVSNTIGSAVEDFSKLMQGDFFFYREYRAYHVQLAYNVAEGTWSKVFVEKWKETFEHEYLYQIIAFEKHNDRLLTCVAIREDHTYTKIKVCELKSMSNSRANWVELSNIRFPEPYPSTRFLKPVAFTEGQLLCCYFRISEYDDDDDDNGRHKRPSPVVYDMAQNRWQSLPSDFWPTSYGSDSGYDCSFVLRPWQAIKQICL